jgi:hypothetical protein
MVYGADMAIWEHERTGDGRLVVPSYRRSSATRNAHYQAPGFAIMSDGNLTPQQIVDPVLARHYRVYLWAALCGLLFAGLGLAAIVVYGSAGVLWLFVALGALTFFGGLTSRRMTRRMLARYDNGSEPK